MFFPKIRTKAIYRTKDCTTISCQRKAGRELGRLKWQDNLAQVLLIRPRICLKIQSRCLLGCFLGFHCLPLDIILQIVTIYSINTVLTNNCGLSLFIVGKN